MPQTDSKMQVDAPLHSDWAYRPLLWSTWQPLPVEERLASGARLGPEVAVFHDCPKGQIALQQIELPDPGSGPRYELVAEASDFGGEFFSFALDLPAPSVRGLKKRHLIRAELSIEAAHPVPLFARLNVVHGPNSEQLVTRADVSGGDYTMEFDLAYSSLNEGRVERMWLDLIFDMPPQNRLVFHDLRLSRRPRAML